MTFKVPESKAKKPENRFGFEVDGTVYSVPHLKYAPVATVELVEQEKPTSAFIAAASDDATKSILRRLDGDQLGVLVEAWAEASGVELGESQASSD